MALAPAAFNGVSWTGVERSADPRRPSWMYVFGVGSLVPAAPSSAALGNMSHAGLW